MDKIQILKMLLEACGNAGEGAAKLAILYFSMELVKFVLLLALWAVITALAYKFFRHVITTCNPPGLEQSLIIEVRDDILPAQRGSLVDGYARNRVTSALSKMWRERPKT